MKLEVGKTYFNREGATIKIIEDNGITFIGTDFYGNEHVYDYTGVRVKSPEHSLVSEANLQLMVGLSYKNREGSIIKILNKYHSDRYVFEDERGKTYTEHGRYNVCYSSKEDLIEEIPQICLISTVKGICVHTPNFGNIFVAKYDEESATIIVTSYEFNITGNVIECTNLKYKNMEGFFKTNEYVYENDPEGAKRKILEIFEYIKSKLNSHEENMKNSNKKAWESLVKELT